MPKGVQAAYKMAKWLEAIGEEIANGWPAFGRWNK